MKNTNKTTFNITTDENNQESVSWLEQHKHFLYSFGFAYLGNQQLIEELFYKVMLTFSKEYPRYKQSNNLKPAVITIFLQISRELDQSQAEIDGEQHLEYLKAFRKLSRSEKESVILTYINGFSREETAQILQISEEHVNKHLFSAIHKLRKELGYGSNFHGCKEYLNHYVDYLSLTMERSEKIAFETHVYHCENCQEDLGTFQDVVIQLTEWRDELFMPAGFLEKIKARIAEQEKQKQQKVKKRSIGILSVVGILTLVIFFGISSGVFSKLYYTLTEDNEEVLAYVKNDLGELLNLESESDGVKIKIKTAVADEYQTIILYEIEDTTANNQYMMFFDDGAYVENPYEIFDMSVYQYYYPPFYEPELDNDEQNVYQGKLILPPLLEDSGTIELKITSVQKIIYYDDAHMYGGYDMEYKPGEWEFEIPVTKKPSQKYTLDKEIEVEGIPVRFEELIVAPTTTILQYSVKAEQLNNPYVDVFFDHLRLNGEKVEANLFTGSSLIDFHLGFDWTTFQRSFDPFFEDKVNDVAIQLKFIDMSFDVTKVISLDLEQEFPQTFEYAGSTLTIEKEDEDQKVNIMVHNDGSFDDFYLWPLNVDDFDFPVDVEYNDVLVDKDGNEYSYEEMNLPFEDLLNYRQVSESVKFHFDKTYLKDNIVKLRFDGFRKKIFVDDHVEISF